MLSVENLSLYRGDNKIFANVGFSVFVGSCLVIRGKNGSGKTSLLKILAGISKHSSGKILWDGQNIEDFRADFNGDLQYIGHKNFLKKQLSVYDNLRFLAEIDGAKILLPSALSYFDMQEIADEKVKNLSAGWQKKALLAKLVFCQSTIWLLDEPLVNLDWQARKKLYDLIKSKIENNGVVIIASHEANFFDFAAKINIEDF